MPAHHRVMIDLSEACSQTLSPIQMILSPPRPNGALRSVRRRQVDAQSPRVGTKTALLLSSTSIGTSDGKHDRYNQPAIVSQNDVAPQPAHDASRDAQAQSRPFDVLGVN